MLSMNTSKHKESKYADSANLSKNGNKYLNENQSLIHLAVNMIKFTIEPQILLFGAAGSSHFSSLLLHIVQ